MIGVLKKRQIAAKLVLMLCLLWGAAQANNVTVTNVSATANDISFRISWQNSWRVSVSPFNWDAVWVFVKYKNCDSDSWTHLALNSGAGAHTIGAPLEVAPSSDNVGAFLQRSSAGTGDITNVDVTLAFNAPLAGSWDFKVHAIEMVYIPPNPFWVGDGSSSSTFSLQQITSEGALAANALIAAGSAVPAAYPKGYQSFYTMKYEISQGQYQDFLNSLTPVQSSYRFANQFNVSRHTIQGSWANYICNTPHRACNFLSYTDVIAYLDWAGLRPITELEYEKACRGLIPSIGGEAAWGSVSGTAAATLTNDGLVNEATSTAVTAGSGLGCYSNVLGGPVRCGFALTPTSNRLTGGASYYGIADMSGNVWETVVNAQSATGVVFTGAHGNGVLTANGDADAANWPAATTGYSYRGGGWEAALGRLAISDRNSANGVNALRNNNIGGRGGRTQ